MGGGRGSGGGGSGSEREQGGGGRQEAKHRPTYRDHSPNQRGVGEVQQYVLFLPCPGGVGVQRPVLLQPQTVVTYGAQRTVGHDGRAKQLDPQQGPHLAAVAGLRAHGEHQRVEDIGAHPLQPNQSFSLCQFTAS